MRRVLVGGPVAVNERGASQEAGYAPPVPATPLSIDHLLARDGRILEEVAGWLEAGQVEVVGGLVLERASLLRLHATLSFLSPVLDAPLPQRIGRLYDLLHHSEDPALVALAWRWAIELDERGEVWFRSLRRPEAMPPDWPHWWLSGSNPRWAERAPVLGLDAGPTCHLQRLDESFEVTLPGRLIGLDPTGGAALTQERGVVRCFDGEVLRWERGDLTGLLTAARFHRDRVVVLGSGTVTVLNASSGETIMEHHGPGLRSLVVGDEVFAVGERTIHVLDDPLSVRFEVASSIAAVVAHGNRLFVTEFWKALHAIDATTGAIVWSVPVKAQSTALAVSPDGARLAVGSAKSIEPLASIFDARDGGSRIDLADRGTCTDVAFDGSGARLFAGGSVFDVTSGQRLGVLAGRGGPVTAATVSPNGRHLVARSPDGLCAFDGEGTLRPLDEARPAIRAIRFGDRILTDGEDTGFERFSMDGRRLEQRSDHLIGVIDDALVTRDAGEIIIAAHEDGWHERWRQPFTGRAWIPPGFDGLVLQGDASFEVRDGHGALRMKRAGRVREAVDEGRTLVIDEGEQTSAIDARDGAPLVTLGSGVRCVMRDGARVAVLRQHEGWELSLFRDGEHRWSTTVDLPRAPDELRLIDELIVIDVRHLELGTEIAEETQYSFDAATGASCGVERSASPSGPGARIARMGDLVTQFFGGSTTVFHRGAPIASLPGLLELTVTPSGPLLIGPRGPSAYELRGRLRASES